MFFLLFDEGYYEIEVDVLLFDSAVEDVVVEVCPFLDQSFCKHGTRGGKRGLANETELSLRICHGNSVGKGGVEFAERGFIWSEIYPYSLQTKNRVFYYLLHSNRPGKFCVKVVDTTRFVYGG